ncbi:hypothetical protein [Hymenobacter profundi]|uniref:Uncharacterized protein n=1 Tax=Hymenobacter profundi TaxID=1982110 RepID=A0ABS6X0I0_9BACT|nr:hypothetical protein [Hymenobacter profundi]MBW3129352.1 hypothetical protein [Hymenobacter profundi]
MSDSTNRTEADEEWETLLHQWRAEVAVPPRPYFYGRVHTRLVNAAAKRPPLRTWRHWPAYAVMLGILLLLSGDDAGLHAVSGGAQQENADQPEASFSGE